MRKRLFLFCGIMIFVFAIGGIAIAMTVSPSTNLTYDERDIDHDNPGIYGSYVVWDTDYEDDFDEDSDIYLYNLADPAAGVAQITDNSDSYAPNIDNGRIVYTYFDGEYYSIRMYTISTEDDIELVGGNDGWEEFPDISGNNVVYRTWDGDAGIDVIMYLNLADTVPTPVQISPDNMQCGRPAVSGNNVVFEGNDEGSNGIYLKDLTQMATEAAEITDDANDYEWPNIDGNIVVYEQDNDDENNMVYSYKIDTEITSQVSRDGEEADQPDIQGNNIVYATAVDSGDPDEWVTFYNMVTGVHTIVSDPVNYCCPDTPAVYGNNLLYLDHWDQVDENYYDSVYHVKLSPTFDPVPGMTAPINIDEGQTIWQNPYIIKVFPTGGTEIVRVEFYIDGVLIGTIYAPNQDGVWECPWDTSLYHSRVRIVAYDAVGESIEITRNTTVSLPYTGK